MGQVDVLGLRGNLNRLVGEDGMIVLAGLRCTRWEITVEVIDQSNDVINRVDGIRLGFGWLVQCGVQRQDAAVKRLAVIEIAGVGEIAAQRIVFIGYVAIQFFIVPTMVELQRVGVELIDLGGIIFAR